MQQKTVIRDFTQGNEFKLLLSFAIPLMGANLLQTVYNLVDMMVIGQFVGSVGLSAVSIGGDLLNLMTFLVMGFASAGQVLLSQYIGAGRRDKVNAAIGTLFTVLLVCAAALSVVCLIFVDEILGLMNTPAEALADARAYAGVCIAGLIFVYGYNLVSAIMRGMGDSKRPLIFIAVATVVNLVLDLLFVAGFGMGPFGAALATVIGQAVSFLWALWYLHRNREAVGFDFKLSSFKPDGEVLPILIKLGIPMSLQFGAIHFSILFVRSFLNDYGVVVSAVTGIGSKLNSVAMVVTNALTTAGSSMIGQNLGAEKFDRVPRIIRVIMTVNLCFVTLLSLITIFFPKAVFGLFNNEAVVLEAALAYVPPAVLSFYGNGMRSPFFALINGSGNSRLNLLVGLLDGLVCRIGLAYFMGVVIEMGIEGFWYGSSLAGYMPVIIGLIYYFSKTWRAKPRAVRQYV